MKGKNKKVIGSLTLGFALLQFSLLYAAQYAPWARYDYPAPSAVIQMAKGDINGDGIEETIAISGEGDEKAPLSLPPKSPMSKSPGTLSITVNPNPFDATMHAYVTFGNLPTKAMIMVYNQFDKMVWRQEIWWGTSTYNWDVRDWNGNKLPSGGYKWIVVNLNHPEDKAEGILTVQNVEDREGGVLIRILKFNNAGSGQLMDKLRIDIEGIPLPTNLKVEDVDNDGKDEIIFSLMTEKKIFKGWHEDGYGHSWTQWDSEMYGYVYVYGWDGNKLVREYQSPNLLQDTVMFGLDVADTDGDGKKEILVGQTKVNKPNSDATSNKIDLLEKYLDNENYFAAANLLHSGILVGPLLDANLVKIKCNGNGNFDTLTFYPAGPGLLYRLTAGNLNLNGTETVVADVTDLNYANMNKFIEDLGWAIAKASINKSTKAGKNASQTTSEDSDGVLFKIFTPMMEKLITSKEFKNILPAAEVNPAINLFQKAVFGEKQMNKSMEYGSMWHPWYSNDVREELISWTEELLVPEGIKIPDVPNSLIDAKIRLLNWMGSHYALKDSERVGIFTTNTEITKEGQIVVKAIVSNLPHMKNLGDAFISNLVKVEEVWRERWVDPNKGEKKVNKEDFIALKNLPQLTGVFWVGKLHKFDADLNSQWTKEFEGPFNSNLTLRDLNDDSQEEVIIGIGNFDWTKVNPIINHLNAQWQLFKQYEQTNKGGDFIPLPPDIPEDILTGGMAVYNPTGTLIYSNGNLGDRISGIAALGKVNGDEEIAVGITEIANYPVIKDYIDDWQAAISNALTNRASWRAGSFTLFMNDLLPKIEEYNNWAIEWHKYGCQKDYWGQPINPNPPLIYWPSSLPKKPDVVKPADPTDNEIKSILSAKVKTYKYGSIVSSWESPLLGHALTSLMTQNVDNTATTYLAAQEIIAAGVDAGYFIEDILAKVKDEREPETTIYVFKSPADSGTGTLTGKVVNVFDNPLAGAKVEIFKGTQSIGQGTTSVGGTYTITANFPAAGTYTVKASYGIYYTIKTTTIWPGEINYLNFKIIDYSQWVKINEATSTTLPAGGTMTITSNSCGTGSTVNIYIYHDEGTIGVLDAADWIIETLEIEDNSHIDEDSTPQNIQLSQPFLWDMIFTGNYIIQAIDIITQASAYARVTATQTTLPQSISGKVTVDGNPAQDIIVSAWPGEGNVKERIVFTDSSGDYKLYVLPGSYEVNVFKMGYPGEESTDVYVGVGSSAANVNFALTTTGLLPISGRVTTTDGQPVVGAEVNARDKAKEDDEGQAAFTFTNINGSYTLYVKPGVTYWVKAQKGGYSEAKKEVSSLPAASVDFILTKYTGMIIGTVTGSGPIMGAEVEVRRRIKEGQWEGYWDYWEYWERVNKDVYTNIDGHYLLQVPQGNAELHVTAEKIGYAESAKMGIIAGATNVNLSLFAHNGTISGTVYCPDGSTPLAFAEVKAICGTPPDVVFPETAYDGVEIWTDPNGKYELLVREGWQYQVRAKKEGYQSPPLKYATATASGINFVMGTPTTKEKEWTFMVYLDGDNNLEQYAINDFIEMAQVGSNDKINIVVQMDRIPGYNGYGNWDICHRFLVQKSVSPWPENAISNWGDGSGGREVNMGSPTVLLDFINWATTNYPAQKYALVLWNHGGGWRAPQQEKPKKAVCWDDTNGGDCLFMSEVRQAIGSASAHLNLVGFDACLMGMVESAYALRGQCDVMVASEELEPEDGWPYETILADLAGTPTMTANELGKVIVTRYGESYEGIDNETTQSAVDMSKLSNLVTAIDTFANSMNWPATHTDWQKVTEARGAISAYGEAKGYHGIDIYFFADKVQTLVSDTNVKNAAANLKGTLSSAIITNYRGSQRGTNTGYGSYGLALYFPRNASTYNSDSEHSAYEEGNTNYPVDYVKDHNWDNFLQRFYNSVTIYVSESGNDFTGNGSIENPYKTIQKGINLCVPPGTILVLPGTYTESITINKKVSLAGSGRPTIIAPGSNQSVVNFSGNASDGAEICGFRIQGASGHSFYNRDKGNGIFCSSGADPIIKNNILTKNDCGIGGDYSSPDIKDNTITNNNNYGIYTYYSSSTVTGNLITYNTLDGINCSYSQVNIINNRIIENSDDGIDCSSTIYSSIIPVILNNIIKGNKSDGICSSSACPSIVNNVIVGNMRGVACYHCYPYIINNTIVQNIQHGIYSYMNSGYEPTITNNIITNNGTSGIYCATGNYDISYNDVWNNGKSGTENYIGCNSGIGDITIDPLFVGEDNYHLQGNSGCINKGSNIAVLFQQDIEGKPRISNGRVDLGAYEYQGTPTISGTIKGTITYSGTKTGTAYVWHSIDPFFEHPEPEIGATFTINAPGGYPFTMANLLPNTYYLTCSFDAEPPYVGQAEGDVQPGDIIGLFGGSFEMIDGEFTVTGTPTPVVVYAGSIISGINFSLNFVIPPLPRIPMPLALINVDGTITDWTLAGIPPAGTDTAGDNMGPGTSTKLSGSDLKAVYIAQDAKNLYLRLDIYGTANTMFQNNGNDPARAGRYNFRINSNANVYNNIEIGIAYNEGQGKWMFWAWDSNNNHQHILALENQGIVATEGGIIELGLPKDVLGHPSEFTVRPSVSYWLAENNRSWTLDRIQPFIAYLAPVNVALKINGTISATTIAGGSLTLTCNSSPDGRFEFYNYHDEGTIGVLDANDLPVPNTFFEIDNSYTDENPDLGQIKRTTLPLFESTGDFIIQAVDMTTGSSSYACVKFTPPAYPKSISGTVTLNGIPTSNLIVFARDGSDNPRMCAITDAKGQYILKVQPGSWLVEAFKFGCPHSLPKEVYVDGNDGTANFDLYTTGIVTITGKVSCAGGPAKGVQISARSEEGVQVEAITGSAGTYTLNVFPGKIWTLEARNLGYNSSPQKISVSTLPASEVNFELTRNTAPVTGIVTGSGEVFGAQVWAGKDGYSGQEGITNLNGHYLVYLPEATGKWHINASKLGSAYSPGDAYPGDEEVNLWLYWHNGTISGTVYAPNGTTGLGFVRVEAYNYSANQPRAYIPFWDRVMTFTNPDGTYHLPVLEDIAYIVGVKKNGYESPATQTMVAGNEGTFTMIGPDLILDKWGGSPEYGTVADTGYVLPGGTITYHVIYKNEGGDAHNVTISDTLPQGVEFITQTSNLPFSINGGTLTWQVGTMTKDQANHFAIVVKVTDNNLQPFVNVVKINTIDYEANTSNNQSTWTTKIFNINLAIRKSGPEGKPAGEAITYQIEFENTGIEDCGSVTITDILPVWVKYAGNTVLGSPTITGSGTQILSWQIGTVSAGPKTQFDLTVMMATNTPSGLLANAVEIYSINDNGPTWNNRATWTTKVGRPELAINKWGPDSVIAGYDVQYQINFKNIGEIPATSVSIIDTLPGSVTYVSNTFLGAPTITGSGTADSPQILTWSVPRVGLNEFGYFVLNVKVGLDARGILTNIIKIIPVSGELDLSNNYATWTMTANSPILDLAVHKSAPNNIYPNEMMTYRISYHNYSNIPLYNIEIKDTLPGSVTYISNTQEWKVGTPSKTGSGTAQSPQVLIWRVKDLPAWTSSFFDVFVTTAPDVCGVLSNKVEITKLPGEVKLYDNEETVSTVVVPLITDLAIYKWAPERIIRGDDLTYSISYSNRSRIDAYDVEIIDKLPQGVEYKKNTLGIEPKIIQSADGNILIWPIGTVTKWYWGAFNLDVTMGTFTHNTLINTITITTLTREDDLANNKSVKTTYVDEPYFDLAVTKYHSYPYEVLIGKETSYTINYYNYGNIPVGIVTIKDILPPDVRYVSNTDFGSPTITGSGTNESPYELTWDIGTVSARGGWWGNFGVTIFVGTKTSNGDKLNNVVEIDTQLIGTDTNKENNRATCTISAVAPAADLSIRKWAYKYQYAPGEVVTYVVSYANYGNIPVPSATITDMYTLVGTTSGIESVEVEGIGSPTQEGNLLTWKLGTINPSWWPNYFYLKIKIKEDADWPGTLTNQINITTDTNDKNPNNNHSEITINVVKPEVDLSVNKWGNPYDVLPGGKVVYGIRFQNTGNTEAGNVVLKDILPAGLSYFSDTSGKTHTITGLGTTASPYVISWDYGTVTMTGWNREVRFQLTCEVGTNTPVGPISNVLAISTSATETAYYNNTVTCTTKVVQPEVNLGISKYAPAEVTPGQKMTYTIYCWNNGNISATNTVITDYLPGNVTYVSHTGNIVASGTNTGTITWQLGTVQPGWYGFNVTVLVGTDIASGTILANVAEISSACPDYHLNNNRATATTKVVVEEADLQIYKFSVWEVLTGKEFSYQIRYRNTGNIPATNTTITDYLPGSVTYVSNTSSKPVSTSTNQIIWQIGTVSPGWWIGFDVRVKLGTDTTGSTILTNVVEISSPTKEKNPTDNRATVTTRVVEPEIDLTISKSASSWVGVGQQLTYHITYRNMNRGEAGSATIIDYLPQEVSYVSDNSGLPHTVTVGNQVIWTVGTLSAWSSKNFKLIVQLSSDINASSTLTNVIVINTELPETNYNNNQATTTTHVMIPKPDLTMHKWGQNELTAGHQMEYNLKCINQGNGKAFDVQIRDILPEGLTYVGNTGGLEPGTNGNVLTWSIGNLSPNESKFFKVRVNVGLVPASSTLVNVAEATTITNEDNLTNNRSTFTTHVVEPRVELSVYKFGPRKVLSGANIEYTITYSNQSSSDAINSTITDTLDSAVSYVSNTLGTPTQTTNNQLIWQVGTIPAWYAGSFKLTVSNSAPASTTLTNIIEIESSWEEDNMANNRATTTTHVEEPGVDLKTHKWGDEARPGFKKSYHITYSNEGTEKADNILLKDTLPNEVEYLSCNPQGNYDTTLHAVSWNISEITAQTQGNATIDVRVPIGTPLGLDLYNTIEISTTAQEKDYTNNKFIEIETVVGAVDPNDKLACPQRYIKPGQLIDFTIRCENVATATANAILITIIDGLNPAYFDLSTMVPGEVGIGGVVYSSIDAFNKSGRGSLSFTYDSNSGTITWAFDFGNNANGLPPNVTSPDGEGYVKFSVKLKDSLANETEITNTANIQFDYNPWIPTPPTLHVIDLVPPTSTVTSLSPTQSNVAFEISWAGTDTTSHGTSGAISSYDIYYSDNGGALMFWFKETTGTSATFRKAVVGHTYSFRSIAKDMAGNVETKVGSDTSTTVVAGPIFRVNPATKTVSKGDIFTVNIDLGNAPAFTALEPHLTFNPAILEVKGINPGNFPAGGSVLGSQYNNTNGTIDYGVGLLTGSDSGTGTVITITFAAKAIGNSNITFNTSNTLLLYEIESMFFQTINGAITVKGTGTGQLQGWTMFDIPRIGTHSGIEVSIEGTNWTTTTNADGYFYFPEVVPNTYGTISTYVPGASPRIWKDVTVIPGLNTLGTLTLLNADANGVVTNGYFTVNAFDFGYLRMAYFKNSGDTGWQDTGTRTRNGYINSDFSGDNEVNAYDFGVLRKNYFKEVAQTYTTGSKSPSPPKSPTPLNGSTATLKIAPSPKEVKINEEFTLQVRLEDVPAFTTVDLRLAFNPTQLEVATLTQGGFPTNGALIKAEFDNNAGKIDYAVGLFSGTNAGSGTVANITFKAKNRNGGTISCRAGTVVLNELTEVPITTISGSVTVIMAITSITHDATKPLKAGEVLTVTVVGDANGTATFDIGTFKTGLPMTETSPGTYTGTYTVQQGNNITQATVTGHLTIGASTVSKSADVPVTFDTTNPTLNIDVPATIGMGTVTIKVTANEPIGTPTLLIKDRQGATITSIFVGLANSTYTYQAVITSDNKDGTATIIAEGTDLAGNPGSATTTFQISIPRKLEVATGTPQTGTVYTTLTPFVVKLTDNLDKPIQGHTINWTIVSAPSSATLSATITTTNAEGLASITLTLGTKTGTYIVTAQGSMKATFTATATPGTLTKITISPNSPFISVNQPPFLFTASGYDKYDNEIEGLIYDWSKEGDIGLLTFLIGTSTQLIATSTPTSGTISAGTQAITGSTKVEVVFGQLTSVSITPATSTVEMEMWGTQSFTAQGFNQYNCPIEGATYTWTLEAGIGNLKTTTTQTVIFTATNTGTAKLWVKVDFGTQTVIATATIKVVKGNVHHINVQPAINTIEAGGTTSVTAKAYNQHDYELTEISKFVWQIVEGSGTVTGNSGTVILQTNDVVGTLTLTAATNTVTGTATVTVSHGSVNRITITTEPTPFELEAAKQGTLTAHAYNRFNHEIPQPISIWQLILTQLGQLSTTTGTSITFMAGTQTGVGTITAVCENKTATTRVIVKPGPIAKLAFLEPATLTVGMPGTMTIQTQDRFGNPSLATNTTIIISGDAQSRFAPSPSGAIWTVTGIFTIADTNNATFFFKQNGTTTTVTIATITATGVNTSTTYLVTIQLLGTSSSGTVVGDDGKTKVEVGSGSLTGQGYIEIDTSGTSTEVSVANQADDANRRINRVDETLRRFTLKGGVSIGTGSTVRIEIPYPDADGDGYVDQVSPTSPRMRIASLKIYQLANSSWVPMSVQNYDIDYTNKVVWAHISSFSEITLILMGAGFEENLTKALVYPNPYYAKHTCIYFDRLTENSTIQIFTIAGELVWETRVTSPREEWNIRNSAGEKVASGIYIYLIKDPVGNKKVGKLGVLR